MMNDLLELVLKNITVYPDEVKIEVTEEEGKEVYTITVNPEDMGRVIGKNGKVIRALRSLAHVIAIRQNKRFRINVAEVGGEKTLEAGETVTLHEESTKAEDSENANTEDILAEAIDSEEE